MNNKILVITGMHRSGTSLITNWLQKCGLEVGERLLGPAVSNAEGHYEDVEFYKMHEEVLIDNNLPSTGIATEGVEYINPYHTAKIKSIIDTKNSKYEQWGWKDPRTCLFLNVYNSIIPEANYLVIFRKYNAVVTSLLKRAMIGQDEFYEVAKGYFSKKWYHIKHDRYTQSYYRQHAELYLKVWIHYNESILKMLHEVPAEKYLVVNYNKLIVNDDEVITHLNDQWHFALNAYKFSNVYQKSLVSDSIDIEQYISNKQLIEKAEAIEEELQRYMTI